MACDVADHFICEYAARRGSKPDVNEFRSIVDQSLTRIRITTMLADARYDSKGNHKLAPDENSVRTVILTKHDRPTRKPPRGRHRRQMQVRFNG